MQLYNYNIIFIKIEIERRREQGRRDKAIGGKFYRLVKLAESACILSIFLWFEIFLNKTWKGKYTVFW